MTELEAQHQGAINLVEDKIENNFSFFHGKLKLKGETVSAILCLKGEKQILINKSFYKFLVEKSLIKSKPLLQKEVRLSILGEDSNDIFILLNGLELLSPQNTPEYWTLRIFFTKEKQLGRLKEYWVFHDGKRFKRIPISKRARELHAF